MSRLVKPPRWQWDPGLTDQRFVDRLRLLMPYWGTNEGAGAIGATPQPVALHGWSPYRHATVRMDQGSPDNQLTERGPADTYGASTTRRLLVNGDVLDDLTDELTIVAYVRTDNWAPQGTNLFVTNWGTNQPGAASIFYDAGANQWKFQIRNASGTQFTASSPADTTAGWKSLVLRVGEPEGTGTFRLQGWINGLQVATNVGVASIYSGAGDLAIGNHPTVDAPMRNGDLSYLAVWGRALAYDEIRALAHEPFRLLEQVDYTAIITTPSVGPVTGEAILQGVGTVTADGQTSATGAADLAGTGTLTADGTIGIPTGQAALTGTGILVADGTAIVPIIGEAILQGVGILTAQSLPELSILTIRQLLAEGIRQSLHLAGRDDVAVYEYPPETVVVPSVVIMPDEPYWVPSNFGRSPLERIRVNLELQMLTPRLEVSESFNDLERLGGIVLQGTLRVPVVQWTEMGQPEGVTVNDIETIMTRASVMAHV